MPTASKSGTRNAIRRTWRACDRPRSRPGHRSRPRPNAFTQLESGLRALIRFHETHPDWFPPVVVKKQLDPEWEDAIQRAYGATLSAGPSLKT
jgi:hypothetical protein